MYLQYFILPIFTYFMCYKLTSCDEDDDVCDAVIADTCFTDVADDLRFVFDPANNFVEALNETALRDLCSAWNDSLQCTRDIIDTTCTKDEGREKFDKWNDGLFRGVELLCHNGMTNLKAVASTIQCWSITEFFHCVEKQTNLTSVNDLLKTSLSGKECDVIKYAFDDCHWEATNFNCLAYEIVRSTIEELLREFFKEINCEEKEKPSQKSTNNCDKSYFSNYIITSLFFILLNAPNIP